MDNSDDAKNWMIEKQIIEAYKILMNKGVKLFRIYAFLVSNTVTNYYYTKLEKELFNANIAFINLSGGVGIAYKPEQIPNDISIIGNNVHKIYNEILAPEGMGNIPTHKNW